MKVLNLVGLAASLLCLTGASPAQNLLTPGELAKNATLTRSSFDSAVEPAPIMPKQNIAYVETRHEKHMRELWIASIVAMTASTAADACTSWHQQEGNGLLASSNGTFGAKGVAVKAGIATGVLVPQIIFRKHRDWHTAFAVSNFAEAGIFTGAAVHNLAIK